MIDESVIFKQSSFYEKNIKFFSLNLDKLLKKKKLNSKNLSILDYGCGNCLLHKYIKFKNLKGGAINHSTVENSLKVMAVLQTYSNTLHCGIPRNNSPFTACKIIA